MPYMIYKHPSIRVDIMFPIRFWADVVSFIERTECVYWREDKTEPQEGDMYIILRDIQARKGHQIGELIGLLYGLELKGLTGNTERPEKFYILITPRKRRKGKHHAEEIRKEIHPGSEGGNRGESAGDIRPGEAAAACGNSTGSVGAGADAVLGQT